MPAYDWKEQDKAESKPKKELPKKEPVHSFPCPYCGNEIAYEVRADAEEEHTAKQHEAAEGEGEGE